MRIKTNFYKLKIISKICNVMGINTLFYKLNRRRKKIICYHNIIPDIYFDDSINLDYSTKESNFRKQLSIINDRFEVGLDIDNNEQLSITFDDGYLNQYLLGSSILDEYKLCGYFFFTSELLEEETLGIDKIQFWIDNVPKGIYKLDDFKIDIQLCDSISRRNCYSNLINVAYEKNISYKSISEALNNVYEYKNIKVNDEFYRLRFCPYAKEDMRKMKNKGHKVGAHSYSHEILSRLNYNDLENDIKKCSSLIGDIYNTKVFCYPFGGNKEISKEVLDLVKYFGFEKAIAFKNSHDKENIYDRFFIPRFSLHDTDDKDIIDFELSGAKYFLKYRRLFPKY